MTSSVSTGDDGAWPNKALAAFMNDCSGAFRAMRTRAHAEAMGSSGTAASTEACMCTKFLGWSRK